MVFHQCRAILVHVPKTGGQSIKDRLGRDQSNVDGVSSYYSPVSRRIIADLYAEDLERFGYRFESVAMPAEAC